jgi:GPH family glycoside/pentoside/hexuronide:cation symporter
MNGAVPAPAVPGWPALAAYGGLRMPLALLELPLFVLLPAFYGQQMGMSLALVGAVLFGARMIDAVTDPMIGAGLDRTRHRFSPRRWILVAAPLMFVGFIAMLNPPEASSAQLAIWLALSSILTYVAWSAVSIAHQAWGSGLAFDDRGRVRVTGVREAFGLAGVLVSALLLDPSRVGPLSVLFGLLLLAALLVLTRAPLPWVAPRGSGAARAGFWRQMREPLRADRGFRRLLAAFMLNGTATAIPATLVLFFVADVLNAPGQAPFFLFLYFVAGALGMPAWIAVGARLGLRFAWLLGMGAAVLAFIWAWALGEGDTTAFALICILSGLALGADLAMPSALLARRIASAGCAGRDEGAYFGIWSLATKLNLAIAAGAGLTLLEILGYRPGSGGPTWALSLAYAALPCVLKLGAALLLARSDADRAGALPFDTSQKDSTENLR